MDYELHGIGPAAGAGGAQPPAVCLSAAGILRLCPLYGEHLYRPGVGRRHRGPGDFQPGEAGRPPVGQGGEVRGDAGAYPHLQAPRRLLPVAQPVHGALGGPQPLSRRQGRHCKGNRPGLPGGRLRFGVYLSPWDRNNSLYGQGKAYDDYFCAQLEELLHRVW